VAVAGAEEEAVAGAEEAVAGAEEAVEAEAGAVEAEAGAEVVVAEEAEAAQNRRFEAPGAAQCRCWTGPRWSPS
jgi:hypothetical protein